MLISINLSLGRNSISLSASSFPSYLAFLPLLSIIYFVLQDEHIFLLKISSFHSVFLKDFDIDASTNKLNLLKKELNKYMNFEDLSREMLHRLVERIEVCADKGDP